MFEEPRDGVAWMEERAPTHNDRLFYLSSASSDNKKSV